MSDFRQAVIDAILEDLDFDSAKELRAYVSKNKQDDYFYGGILYAINAVQDLPSAQPEIIRCKDCKWCQELYDSFDGTPYWMCKNWDGETDTDGFCHEAERRTNERC